MEQKLFSRRSEPRVQAGSAKPAEAAPRAPSGRDPLEVMRSFFGRLSPQAQADFLQSVAPDIMRRAGLTRISTAGQVVEAPAAPQEAGETSAQTRPGERRKSPRQPTQERALIVFNDNRSTLSCDISDRNDTGARLACSNAHQAPEVFRMLNEGGGEARLCRRIWTRFGEMGVRFLG